MKPIPYYVNAGYYIRHKILAHNPCEAACKIVAKYGSRPQEPIIYVDEQGFRGVIGVEKLFTDSTYTYDRDYIIACNKG